MDLLERSIKEMLQQKKNNNEKKTTNLVFKDIAKKLYKELNIDGEIFNLIYKNLDAKKFIYDKDTKRQKLSKKY